MVTSSIRRGLAAGLLAGVLAGLFALTIGEIPVREAIRLEEAADAAAAADGPVVSEPDDEFPVSRTTQQALLPVATAVVGAAFGGLFGVVTALVRPRLRDRRPWYATLKLGAGAWLAVVALPALTHPPNPPAVGAGDAIGVRSGGYVGSIVAGLVLVLALWALARHLRSRIPHVPARQLVVAVTGAVSFGAFAWLLPHDPSPVGDFPGDLLWQFRLASLATQTLLWAGIAAISGWLWHRAEQVVADEVLA